MAILGRSIRHGLPPLIGTHNGEHWRQSAPIIIRVLDIDELRVIK